MAGKVCSEEDGWLPWISIFNNRHLQNFGFQICAANTKKVVFQNRQPQKKRRKSSRAQFRSGSGNASLLVRGSDSHCDLRQPQKGCPLPSVTDIVRNRRENNETKVAWSRSIGRGRGGMGKTGLSSMVGHPRLSMNHKLGNLKKNAMGLYDETRPAEYLDCDEETLIQNCTIFGNMETWLKPECAGKDTGSWHMAEMGIKQWHQHWQQTLEELPRLPTSTDNLTQKSLPLLRLTSGP